MLYAAVFLWIALLGISSFCFSKSVPSPREKTLLNSSGPAFVVEPSWGYARNRPITSALVPRITIVRRSVKEEVAVVQEVGGWAWFFLITPPGYSVCWTRYELLTSDTRTRDIARALAPLLDAQNGTREGMWTPF